MQTKKIFVFHYIGMAFTKLSNGYAEEGWKSKENQKLYVEYDGFTCEAKNEKEAWNIFLGTDGKFGIPDYNNYTVEEQK